MNQVKFHIYTFIGSFPWCYALAYIGMRLGDKFRTDPRFKSLFDRFHVAVEVVIVAAFVYFVVSHWKNRIRTDSVYQDSESSLK
jgi:membrane protein DedA with SNARE-associated domain